MTFDSPFVTFLKSLRGRPVIRLVTVRLGVWDVAVKESSAISIPGVPDKADVMMYSSYMASAWRFTKEVYSIAPQQFMVYTIHELWQSFESGLLLYASGQLTDTVITHIQEGMLSDSTPILRAVLSRIALVLLSNGITKLVQRDKEIFRDRVRHHFTTKSMKAILMREDGATGGVSSFSLKTPAPHNYMCTSAALQAFEGLTSQCTSLLKVFSQLSFTFNLVRQIPLDPIFVAINVLQPFMSFSNFDHLWTHEYLIYSTNVAFKRMIALSQLAFDSSYGTDIKSDGAGSFILKEFERNRESLGDQCIESAHDQWYSRKSLARVTTKELFSILPTLYYAIRLILRPGSLTFNSYTILQQAAGTIRWSLASMTMDKSPFLSHFQTIENIYLDSSAPEEVDKGTLSYPSIVDKSHRPGMKVEFRDVTFKYPGASKNALNNVSFTIKPGQLVAIVGVNGSGKSSITKLFNRLYDPTEGEILVDDIPICSYKLGDVRRCMAILRQNHVIYPLSLRENIALGLPNGNAIEHDLAVAIQDGGASKFIEKLPQKLDTELTPVPTLHGKLLAADGSDAEDVKSVVDNERTIDISGGESQRLAASRTFMRLRGGSIRLLAADEPSSALDPEGEFELFSRLVEQRRGMTVVFITHRFGHITKHADLILCMKDGILVETGTHDELIAKGEEYFKLHSIQAQAFSDNDSHVAVNVLEE